MVNQLNRYTLFLQQKGYIAHGNSEGDLILINYPENEDKHTLSIDFSSPFPYDFPKIYIDSDFRKKVKVHAHVFKDDSLCLKFSGKEIVNPTKDEEVLEYALDKACKIIDRAIEGSLNIEKSQEIKEYWTLSNPKGIKTDCFSFFRSNVNVDIISIGTFHLDGEKIFLYETDDNYYGKDYVETFASKPINEISKYRCLFVRIEDSECAYALRIFSNLINYLYDIKSPEINDYLDNTLIGMITLIVSSDEDSQYSTMYIRDAVDENKQGARNENRLISEQCMVVNMIPKIMTQLSLFNRSSDGHTNTTFKKICIVGCGSLGSHVANDFASIGAEEFVLIDYDRMADNNLLRHISATSSIGELKTRVLRRYLLDNYPYLKVNELPTSVFNCKKELFAKDYFDLIVVATADRSSEFYCLEELLSNSITKKAVILWIEPFAVSGHALVYDRDSYVKGNFDLLQSNVNHISSVQNSEVFFQKEAGCSSAYIPYSGLDVREFLISLIKSLRFNHSKPFSYSKFLNIDSAKRNSAMKINPIYFGFSDGGSILGDIYGEE
ncbi:ThiF family adenylyltransferase [Erysipelothrix anatis]|uniref:ThiF family adenylyltransferase n=1 Tax=Erysipelothrix anatis TaxID=2683713 RepID=UPI00140A9C84|nr:ThiF family adenylyltransferase [Erysipelothrix anatis]